MLDLPLHPHELGLLQHGPDRLLGCSAGQIAGFRSRQWLQPTAELGPLHLLPSGEPELTNYPLAGMIWYVTIQLIFLASVNGKNMMIVDGQIPCIGLVHWLVAVISLRNPCIRLT